MIQIYFILNKQNVLYCKKIGQVRVGLAHEGFRTIHYLYNIRHYIIINFFSDLAEILNARISNLKKNEETHY